MTIRELNPSAGQKMFTVGSDAKGRKVVSVVTFYDVYNGQPIIVSGGLRMLDSWDSQVWATRADATAAIKATSSK